MAEFVIDYGPDWHLQWVVFINATGECKTVQNPDVRLQRNETLGTQPGQDQATVLPRFRPRRPTVNRIDTVFC